MELKFINGFIFYKNLQLQLIPINSLICILNEIIENEENSIEILKESSKIDAKILFEEINNTKKPNIIKIKDFIQILNSFGIGKISLKKFQNEKIIFNLENCVLNKLYQNLYKKTPKVILEHIIIGFLENFISLLLNKIVKSSIIEKNKIILIEITVIKETMKCQNSEASYKIPKVILNKNQTISKIIQNNQIIIKNGTLNIWNAFGTLIPYFYLIELFSKLDSNKYEKFFEEIGIIQGKAAVNFQKIVFGINGEKLFSQVIEQSELIGAGIVEYNNKLEIKINTNLLNHFLKFYKYDDIYLFYKYFIGIIKGVYEFSYDVETEYIVEKDFIINLKEIKNERTLSKKEKEIDKIINEKALVKKNN